MSGKWQADLNRCYAYIRQELAPLRIAVGAAVTLLYLLTLNYELMARGNSMLQGAAPETASQLADSLDTVQPPGTTLTDFDSSDPLGAFAQPRKASVSFTMSVCPHVSVWLPLAELWLNFTLGTSTNIRPVTPISIKSRRQY